MSKVAETTGYRIAQPNKDNNLTGPPCLSSRLRLERFASCSPRVIPRTCIREFNHIHRQAWRDILYKFVCTTTPPDPFSTSSPTGFIA